MSWWAWLLLGIGVVIGLFVYIVNWIGDDLAHPK